MVEIEIEIDESEVTDLKALVLIANAALPGVAEKVAGSDLATGKHRIARAAAVIRRIEAAIKGGK